VKVADRPDNLAGRTMAETVKLTLNPVRCPHCAQFAATLTIETIPNSLPCGEIVCPCGKTTQALPTMGHTLGIIAGIYALAHVVERACEPHGGTNAH